VGFGGEGRAGKRVEDGKEVEEGGQNVQDVSPPGF
jgi:hypothetical protein